MIVKLTDTGLLIAPETDFEEQYLADFRDAKVFLKTGLTIKDIEGLRIDK